MLLKRKRCYIFYLFYVSEDDNYKSEPNVTWDLEKANLINWLLSTTQHPIFKSEKPHPIGSSQLVYEG
jgi:hypothetical protein